MSSLFHISHIIIIIVGWEADKAIIIIIIIINVITVIVIIIIIIKGGEPGQRTLWLDIDLLINLFSQVFGGLGG